MKAILASLLMTATAMPAVAGITYENQDQVHTFGSEFAYPEVFDQYCNFKPRIVHLAKDNSKYQV